MKALEPVAAGGRTPGSRASHRCQAKPTESGERELGAERARCADEKPVAVSLSNSDPAFSGRPFDILRLALSPTAGMQNKKGEL